jgi:hypothetical protein
MTGRADVATRFIILKEAAMKGYSIYGPPNHVDQPDLRTKEMAQAASEHFDGKVPRSGGQVGA